MSFYKACSERPSHILSAKKLTNQRIWCLVSFVRIETAITGMPRVFTTVGIMIRTWIHCWLTTTGDSKGMLHVFLYWGEPEWAHIDRDNGLRTQNNGMYLCLCIIYPAFVAPWFPRSVYAVKYSVYSSILSCSHEWFTTVCTRLWTARTTGTTHVSDSAMKIIDEDR